MGLRKLTDEQVAFAREQFAAGRSIRLIADDLKCSRELVSKALGSLGLERRMAWKFPEPYEPSPEEIAEHCARFRHGKREEDRQMGWHPPTLAVEYGRGNAHRKICWRRDDDAAPAA